MPSPLRALTANRGACGLRSSSVLVYLSMSKSKAGATSTLLSSYAPACWKMPGYLMGLSSPSGTELGGLQVDEEANLANWVVPGKMVPGMGGAMDLVTGSRKVIIAMEHCAKDGSAKILRRCTMPLTAQHAVHMLVTELAVFRFIDGKMWLTEIADGCDLATVRAKTEARFEVAADLNTQRGDL